jgi:BASS family bile acid:Na+ symporter
MDIIFKVFLPLGLVFIMFSLGLGLTVADFQRVLQRPVAFLVGAFNQIILLPVVAFAIVLLFGISGELAVGFMILAACPGGVTSNVISKLAKADIALSVSLSAVISLGSVITVPLIVAFAYGYFLSDAANTINVTKTAVSLFALTVVPICLAMFLRAKFPKAMGNAEPVVSKMAVALFGILVIVALVSNGQLFIANVQVLGGALLCLLITLLAVGFAVPLLLGRSSYEAKTISIETGVQNS